MTTLIDRITKRIDELKKSTCTKSIVDELERVKAELTAVNGVDELVEKRENEKETDNKDGCYKYDGFYNMFISDLKSLKQTPVVSECKHEYPDGDIKYPCCLCGKIEKPTTEERLKDSLQKEVEIKKKTAKREYNQELYIYGDCTCGDMVLSEFDKYCSRCGSKIKWIA